MPRSVWYKAGSLMKGFLEWNSQGSKLCATAIYDCNFISTVWNQSPPSPEDNPYFPISILSNQEITTEMEKYLFRALSPNSKPTQMIILQPELMFQQSKQGIVKMSQLLLSFCNNSTDRNWAGDWVGVQMSKETWPDSEGQGRHWPDCFRKMHVFYSIGFI